MWRSAGLLAVLVACGDPSGRPVDASTGGGSDGSGSGHGDGGNGSGDGGNGSGDGGVKMDAGVKMDGGGNANMDAATPDAPVGIITGGPCISGMSGKTAYRVRWANGNGTAYPVYEVNGLPTKTPDHTGAYGYQIGFTASYVDPFLAQGGLQLDSSDFVDIDLSTAGISSISNATLSIYGRSYNTTASGSFNWQTFDGVGQTPTNSVSNVAPYAWYPGDMTTEIGPGETVKIRIKAGPNSDALVVNRIELCMTAQ